MTAEMLFWIGVLWLAYVYAGYPLLLALLGLVRRVRPVVSEDFLPAVSVLIAARNEEADIGWKVRETLNWDYPADRLQVLVASDASDDRTDEIVRAIQDPRLKFLRMENRGGKGRALNRLVELSQGELLFFTDANAHIEPGTLRLLVRYFADPRVGCVTGQSAPLHKGDREDGRISGSVYWRFESLVRKLENRLGSVLVCDGAIFVIRRSLFHALTPALANDLELPLRIGRAGYWILHEPDAVVLEEDTSSPAEELSRRRRICAQGLLGMWKLRHTLRGLRGWQFVSHKFLRWLTAVPLAMTLLATVWLSGQPLFGGLLAVELALCTAALAGIWLTRAGRAPGVFSAPMYILLTSAGALIGVFDACFGRRFDVWDSPSLTRGGSGAAIQRASQ